MPPTSKVKVAPMPPSKKRARLKSIREPRVLDSPVPRGILLTSLVRQPDLLRRSRT